MKKLNYILLVSTLIPAVALGEMFPPEENMEPRFRMSDDYKPKKRSYRYGGTKESGQPTTDNERKRRSVEAYLDSARAGRPSSRSYRRPRNSDRSSGVRRRRPRVNYEAGQTEAPKKYYAKPLAYEPQRYQRGYQETPTQTEPTYRAQGYSNDSPPESYTSRAKTNNSQNLNYQNPFSARPAPSPFRPEANESRKNLLDVKRWAQDPTRKVASLDKRNPLATEEDMQNMEGPKEWAIKLRLAGGLSSATNSDATTQSNRESLALGQNFYLGAQADVTAYRYFGGEADFYMGVAPPITVQDGAEETTRSLQHWGFMADAKVQAPIPMDGNLFITPKLGIGFGALGMNESQEGEQTSQALFQVSGMYLSLGADAQLSEKISIGLDYATSLGASAMLDSTSAQGPSQADGSFNRLRIGAYWKLNPTLSLGGQFVSRTISASATTGAGGSESLTQFLGVLQIEL